jgi:hypothetical protein
MIDPGMTRPPASRRLRRYARLALGFFAVFLFTAQFEHHDIACHLKTPQHCSACAASPLGSDPNTPASFHQIVLADAGGATSDALLLTGTVLPPRCSGRSPPADA